MSPTHAVMRTDPMVLDRFFERLGRTLSAGGPDQLRAPFTVGDIMHSLVPYRTYRHELQVDTLQDYEHALLELLADDRALLVTDPETVATIRKELATPDPDTGILRRLLKVQVRMGALRMSVLDLVPPVAWNDGPRHTTARPSPAPVSAPFADAPPPMATIAQLPAPAPATPLTGAGPEPVVPLPPAVPGVAGSTRRGITPIGVASVYGDPISFRGMRHAPVDVGGVIFLFGMVARELGIHVEAMSSGFPRCEAKRQVAPGRWTRVRIDFELESRHYRDAGRAASACDLLVCWRDTWPDRPAPLEVLSLEQALATLAPQE